MHKFDTDDVVAETAPAPKSCCSMSKPEAEPEPPTLGERLVQAVQYGYGRMIADTAKWLFIGLTAAALVTAYVPQSFFLQWGDGVIAMLIMVIVGLPMYICATASTPVAASFLFAGLCVSHAFPHCFAISPPPPPPVRFCRGRCRSS